MRIHPAARRARLRHSETGEQESSESTATAAQKLIRSIPGQLRMYFRM
jgi:hypothetical protein